MTLTVRHARHCYWGPEHAAPSRALRVWLGVVLITLVACATAHAANVVFTPATLNPLMVGVPVSLSINASPVCPDPLPCNVSVTTSGALPPGLTLDTNVGLLSGTPTAAGPYSFTVMLTDGQGNSGSITYMGTVGMVVAVTPTTLPALMVGTPVNVQLTVTPPLCSGGGGCVINIVQMGALPAGVLLNQNTRMITGTPSVAGPYSVTFVLSESVGADSGSAAYTGTVAAAPVCPTLTLAPPTLPNGTVGLAYSQTFTGSGGATPYTFSVTTGTLPAGLTLTPAGVIAGTPTTSGTSAFTIRGTDANACKAESAGTISVLTAVPTLPQTFVVLLAMGLAGIGYIRLRRMRGDHAAGN